MPPNFYLITPHLTLSCKGREEEGETSPKRGKRLIL